jgi:hypothetical protein
VWVANSVAIAVLAFTAGALCLALLWRVALWRTRPVDQLMQDEGLPIGSPAPQVACYRGGQDMHLDFLGTFTLVVFGTDDCRPCGELIEVAARHPATRGMRLVYLSGSGAITAPDDARSRWEAYRFHDETSARSMWRAPVSPYYHLIDHAGRILAKGVANKPEHLDHLLAIGPPSLQLVSAMA